MAAIDFITNLAPHYREQLWLTLLRESSHTIRFIFAEDSNSSIQQIDFESAAWDDFSGRLIRVRNIRFRQALIWQRGVISRVLRTDARVAVVLGDMYVLSSWFAALILKARGIKLVFWGHGLLGNEGHFKRLLRLSFLRLADWNLVYGKRAKALLVNHGFPESRVSVVFNSLDYETQKSLRESSVDSTFYSETGWFTNPELPVLIFIGRLTRQKKLDQLIQVVAELNQEEPHVNLIFVGDGTERPALESQAAQGQGSIHFFGPCYDETTLARLIANADLCVSPGEVGLTAIHCLSYGTPLCTHGNFSEQMPEVEAIVDGKTGIFFQQDGAGLRDAIERWLGIAYGRAEIRRNCYAVIDEYFNPAHQQAIFERMFQTLRNE